MFNFWGKGKGKAEAGAKAAAAAAVESNPAGQARVAKTARDVKRAVKKRHAPEHVLGQNDSAYYNKFKNK